MQIEPWEVPVLAMAVLTLPLAVQRAVEVARRRLGHVAPPPPTPERTVRRERVRTGGLAVLTMALIVIFVAALSASAAATLTSVASAIAALVSAGMAVQSFAAQKRAVAPPEEPENANGRHARDA